MKFLFLSSMVLYRSFYRSFYRSLYRSSSPWLASPSLRFSSSSLRFSSSSLRLSPPSLRQASPSPWLASSGLRLASSSLRLASSSGLFDSPEETFMPKGRGSLRKKKTRLDKCVPIQTQYAPRGLHQRQYVDYLKDRSCNIHKYSLSLA